MQNKIAVNVVGRIDGMTGIGEHTKAFLYTLKDVYDVRFIDSRPDTSDHKYVPVGVSDSMRSSPDWEATVSIFTDVTADDREDKNWEKTPVTKCKYIYSVFDSTQIPLHWADIINNHFDAVFVPSRFLVNVYRNSHVHKPVFYLPLALDLSPYLSTPTQSSVYNSPRRFVFAFVGSREKRKNLETLISCFIDTFRNNSDVTLNIHCALDFYNEPRYVENVNRLHPNVKMTTGELDREAYAKFISNADCYISLSKGEGYSIVPREFLAAGKPVILSDCLAHSEILSELDALGPELAFRADADIPVPGEYGHIMGGGVFGLQYDVYIPSVCDTMEAVYNARSRLFSNEKIERRRLWAKEYDRSALAPRYRSIIEPAFCRMSTGDELEFGGITTRDANLASRLTGANRSVSGIEDIGSDPVKYVVIGNDGGFFSVYNRFVSYLTWTLSENPRSIVLPDWRIASMKKHWNTETFTSFCYGTPEDGNIWLKLFQPLPYHYSIQEDYDDDHFLYADAVLKDDFNEQKEPWLTYIHAYKLYRSPNFPRWRHSPG